VGAFEGIGLVIAGAILQWITGMVADRAKKAEDIDKNLATEDTKLRDKVAELDKTNSTAIATLTVGIEHIVEGLDGIRSDMRGHRDVVFRRLERNESEINDVRNIVSRSEDRFQAIQQQLSKVKGQ
jgi:hypothetical protein